MDNIIKQVKKNDIIIILLILVVVYFLIQYMARKKEKLDNVKPVKPVAPVVPLPKPANEPNKTTLVPANSPTANAQKQQIDKVVAGSAKLTAEDLLPKYKDANEFAKQNPVSKLLKEQNFLVSGYHAGINTVSQSNKIPYLDIRVLPPIPKENVGPWNQSSFEQSPASLRRGLEIL